MSRVAKGKRNGTAGDILVVVGIGLLLIILSPILIPLLIFLYLKSKYEAARLRRFLKRNDGAKFFCYTSKSTGLKFARKNILPYLDSDVQVIYLSQKGRMNLGDESIINTLIGMESGGAKRGGYPCVAKVVDGNLISESLNTQFYRTIHRNASAEPLLLRIREFYAQVKNRRDHGVFSCVDPKVVDRDEGRDRRGVMRFLECGQHGKQEATFVCGHLVDTVHTPQDLLFYYVANEPYGNMWCEAFEEVRLREGGKTGEWNDTSEAFANISVICAACYDLIRQANIKMD